MHFKLLEMQHSQLTRSFLSGKFCHSKILTLNVSFNFLSSITSLIWVLLKLFSLFFFQSNSGFLVTLLFLRTKKTTKTAHKTSFATDTKQTFMLIIYRYIRLTPVYFMVIILNTVTLKYVLIEKILFLAKISKRTKQ